MASDDFHGCKLALMDDSARLLVYLRDDKPEIRCPNMWDLPGGGRENNESAEICVLRELKEEFDLTMTQERLLYKRRYHHPDRGYSYFFAGTISKTEIGAIAFGDEGQHWTMMALDDYFAHPQAIESHKIRLRDCLDALRSGGLTIKPNPHPSSGES